MHGGKRSLIWTCGVLLCFIGAGSTASAQVGPDVIVGDLYNIDNYGQSGGIYAYAIGTESCNIGDETLDWFPNNNQHPVIGQDMFKILDGRFTQIGSGWLKHGFCALSLTLCGPCQSTPCSNLGIGCSDPYGAGLNGSQGNLGPRSQVNANNGFFPYPPADPAYSGNIARRMQVSGADLSAAQNPGALYFVTGHYVTQDDAQSGNGNNNVSYRRVSVSPSTGNHGLSFIGSTQQQSPPMQAWQDFQPSVTLVDVQVPNEGLFIAGYDVIDNGNGTWRYEYAVYNMNSDRSGQSFFLPVPSGVTLTDVGFHDIAWHSGEPYSSTDWTVTETQGLGITWETQTFAENQNANAIRWSMLFNFYFTCDAPPEANTATLGLFKPGPGADEMSLSVDAPSGDFLPAPQAVTCVQSNPTSSMVQLNWTNGTSYNAVTVRRDGAVIANLGGAAMSYTDMAPGFGSHTYTIQAEDAGVFSFEVPCVVDVLPAEVTGLSCTQPDPVFADVVINWTNGMTYNSIAVYRDGVSVAALAGSATSYNDNGLSLGIHTYEIAGVVGAVEAALVDCTIDVLPPPPLGFTLHAEDASGTYDVATGVGSATAGISADESAGNNGFPNAVSGMSMGLGFDSSLVSAVGLAEGAGLSAPDFFDGQVLADGVTIGIVIDFDGITTLSLASETEIAVVSFDTNAANLAGNSSGATATLNFQNGLGTGFPVENLVVVGSDPFAPALDNGSVTLIPGSGGLFVRGDANTDGLFNIADAVSTLSYLFTSGQATCLDALEANDDGAVNIADGIYILSALFSGGPSPLAPFPSCGGDPTPDAIDCVSFSSCP